MDVLDFLRLAESWANRSTEAEWRSAVSRAYYSVFHVARQLLLQCGFEVRKGDQAHAYLWRRLSNCGVSEVQHAGRELQNLRGDRNLADYDMHVDFPQSHAQASVELANETAEALRHAAVEPVRSQMIATIRDYERNVLREVTFRAN